MPDLRDLIDKLKRDNIAVESGLVHGNDKYNPLIKDVTDIYNAIIGEMAASYNRAEATEKVLDVQCDEADVSFMDIDKGIQIIIPRNLPKKKAMTDKYDIALFRKTYMQAFSRYFNDNPKHFSNKVMVHIHSIYLKESEMLDYDNMTIKQILDIITLFLLVDDNPTRYNLYMSAGVGDKRQTIITIEEL